MPDLCTTEEQAHCENKIGNIPLLPPARAAPLEVLAKDRETPDRHVPRDARLIRLTGVHPFNAEPPLTALYDEGFLTSPELFYVRNHGAVPNIPDEDAPGWELTVEGLVENPTVFTLKQIVQDFPQVVAPITLVCAGNRRKEQNVVRKSKGFSWGSAGLSTAIFAGPFLADVLRVAKPLSRARYVCMEGADRLPNGYYGTSLRLNWIMNPDRGIMLAHKMNGEPLKPDHGYPLRAVVPGQIGGRSVKWLKKLIVTNVPSDNWYHIYDNRVLPTVVSPEMSSDPKWWLDERYAIYDLNVNSAIVYPAHEEELDASEPMRLYSLRGYSYGGGGRRITRVEVSLDEGKRWKLAEIEYPEDKHRTVASGAPLCGGWIDKPDRETCFCWCFWRLDVLTRDLSASSSIVVRAMDEAMCVQPRDMYWSVLGMMNNCWFRVTVTAASGGDKLRFEHPTHPAKAGGWMEKVKQAGGDLLDGSWGEMPKGNAWPPTQPATPMDICMTNDTVRRDIGTEELRAHAHGDSPWFVVNGEVYDGTGFLDAHPGGGQSIMSVAGTDATDEFMAIRKRAKQNRNIYFLRGCQDFIANSGSKDSETAKIMMADYHVGTLSEPLSKIVGEVTHSEGETSEVDATADAAVFLQPKAWKKAVLLRKDVTSWNTRLLHFELDHPDQTLGLPVGHHLMVRTRTSITNENIIRSYTPISEAGYKGAMTLLVKVYFSTSSSPGGRMTTVMDKLDIGSPLYFKGPIGKFTYLGHGVASISGRKRQVRSFGMVCGGSGITPIFQVLRAVMQDADDSTYCTVLDGNRLLEDILCKPELDEFAAKNPERCKLVYALTQPPPGWFGARGRISEHLLSEHIPPQDGAMVLVCGPDAMNAHVRGALLRQGWQDGNIVLF